MKDDMKKKLNEFDARLKKFETKKDTPEFESPVQNIVQKALPNLNNKESDEEKMLIEKKKSNLIYFNIPESQENDMSQRLKHDYERLKEIYGEEKIKATDIANIFRVGQKSSKPRPLIVKFSDSNIKQNYIDITLGKELSVKKGNEIVKIGVTHDRTMKQREQYKKLEVEIKSRTENEETGLGIRSNRIVENFQSRQRGTKITWASVVRALC